MDGGGSPRGTRCEASVSLLHGSRTPSPTHDSRSLLHNEFQGMPESRGVGKAADARVLENAGNLAGSSNATMIAIIMMCMSALNSVVRTSVGLVSIKLTEDAGWRLAGILFSSPHLPKSTAPRPGLMAFPYSF